MSDSSIKPWELKQAYAEGRNIMQMVRDSAQARTNDERTIEVSYDLQASSYIRLAETAEGRAQRQDFARQLTEVLTGLGPVDSLMEAGVGEATTLWHVVASLPQQPTHVHGFDLCWSRVGCGARWLERQVPRFDITLCTGSLLEVPYQDNAFDVVYTAHTIEPNHGQEEAILRELYRVTNRYLVLLEPAYELASPEARARMESHGYCRGLPEIARRLGWKVLRHELFGHSANPANPTGLILIEKAGAAAPAVPAFACPAYGTPLERMADCFYSEKSMRAYPIVGGIPCLRSHAAIIASKLGELRATGPSAS